MSVLAVHIDDGYVQVASMKRKRSGSIVEFLRAFSIENGEQLSAQLRLILGKKHTVVVSGLPAEEVVARNIEIHIRSKKGALAALPFQLEGLIPFPTEDMVIIPFLKKKRKTAFEAYVHATRKSRLLEHLSRHTQLGVDPDWVSSIPQALTRFAAFLGKGKGFCKIHYINPKNGCVVLIEDGILRAHQQFHLENGATAKKSLERIDRFLDGKIPIGHSSDILSAGRSTTPLDHLVPPYSLEMLQEYAIPIGLCLDALLKDGLSTQFREGIFLSSRCAAQRKKTLFSAMGACLATTTLLGGIGYPMLLHQHTRLYKTLALLVENYTGKKTSVHEDTFEFWMNHLEKEASEIRRMRDAGAFSPQIHDVFSWIQSFPVQSSEIILQRLVYALLPHEGNVKIELEVSADSKEVAEQFLDYLHQMPWLNKIQGVQWEKTDSIRYQATCFLHPTEM